MKSLISVLFLFVLLSAQSIKPQILEYGKVKYPKEAEKVGLEGFVHLNFELDKKGKIGNIKVEKTSNALFTKAALSALKKYKFSPAKKDGKAVKTRLTLPFRFKLNKEKN